MIMKKKDRTLSLSKLYDVQDTLEYLKKHDILGNDDVFEIQEAIDDLALATQCLLDDLRYTAAQYSETADGRWIIPHLQALGEWEAV